jgi:hypothetical protein
LSVRFPGNAGVARPLPDQRVEAQRDGPRRPEQTKVRQSGLDADHDGANTVDHPAYVVDVGTG